MFAFCSFATASKKECTVVNMKANEGGNLQVGGQHIQSCKEVGRSSEEKLFFSWFDNPIAAYLWIVSLRSDVIKPDFWKLTVRHSEMQNKEMGVENTGYPLKRIRRRDMMLTWKESGMKEKWIV